MKDQNQQPWPDRFSERFHVFTLGESFDVDSYLATSTLRPDFVWRRMGNGPTNGFEILLGDAQVTNLVNQEKIAISYLKEHRNDLRALAQFPGVEALNLGLVYHVKHESIGFVIGPPNELMHCALDACVSPLYYLTILER